MEKRLKAIENEEGDEDDERDEEGKGKGKATLVRVILKMIMMAHITTA